MRLLLIGGLVLALAGFAQAGTCCYGWEDGSATIIGSYGANLVNPLNVTGPYVHTGLRSLQVTEAPHTGTPQAYIAWITGLTDGDVVDASFWGWDDTPGASPSLRIWAHYTLGDTDPQSYVGSASGPSDYTDGTGWSQLSYSWIFDSSGGTRDGLMIEARLYSDPATDPGASTDYWIDDVCVTAPDGTTITFPGGPSGTEETSWGDVKSLFR